MKLSIPALLAKIAGGGLAGLAPLLGSLFPKQQALFTTIFGASGLLVLVAGIVAQSLQPAAKLVEDATIVTPAGTPTGATAVSTSSELLPGNQAKGNP